MQIKAVLIGLGGVAREHMQAYARIPALRITAGASRGGSRGAALAEAYGFALYTDYQEMVRAERPDLVCVLAPAAVHCEIVCALAGQAPDILCEKPLCVSLPEAEAMLGACRDKGTRLHYGASYRFLPACERAKAMLDAGAVGRPVWMCERVAGGQGLAGFEALEGHYPAGGPGGGGMGLMDHGIHMIDLFRWYNGCEVTDASGRCNIMGEAPGPEYLTLRFANGCAAQLSYCETTYSLDLPGEGVFSEGRGWAIDGSVLPENTWHPHPVQLYVYGTAGALRIYPYANKLYWHDGVRLREVSDLERLLPGGQFERQMRALLQSRADGQVAVPAAEGREALRAILDGCSLE